MFKKIYEWASKVRNNLNEKGQGMVEYALILAAVAVIAVVALMGTTTGSGDTATTTPNLKTAISGAFQSASEKITSAQTSIK